MKYLTPVAILVLVGVACERSSQKSGLVPAHTAQPATAPAPSPPPTPATLPTPAGAASTAPAAKPIVLHARDVTLHGKTVRYEPEPHKDTIGYWSDPADWVSWEFDVPAPGTYAVAVLQGCGAGSGGSEVEVAAGDDRRLTFTVEDTGGFQNFVEREVGSFTFDLPGRYTLAVRPKTKPGVAVMDLRQVTLTPAER